MQKKPYSNLAERVASFLIILLAVLEDQLSKQWAIMALKPIRTMPVIEGVFHFTYRENTGAAFSLFSAPDERWIFLTISSVAIVGMTIYLFAARQPSGLTCCSLAMIIGGGIGNMIDRLANGFVVDFIDVRIIHFPVFNMADCFVCIGTGLLLLAVLLEWRNEGKATVLPDDAGKDNG